ncbi:MAG: hypothetical protein JSU98_12980 [Gemmatimonadales bacterium]|nr:MAG: hypothetical protein JSU98_12980 [Gemmatimonadales bacterium]
MTRPTALAAALAASVAFAPGLAAQMEHDDSPAHRIEEVLSVLEFREIGPTIMGGRISDLAVNEDDPRIFYVGTATGGLWKTTSAGTWFEPVFEDHATSSIGDVTLAPSNPRVVWVGTGEPQNRQSSPYGNGVYRSIDGGQTWSHLGLEDTHHIARIQVHPADPDVAYVAAMGHLWGSNEMRGVFRTTDGGESWDKVLYIDEHTGAIDLIMDPNDPKTVFAAMYQRQRRAWGFNGGGPGSGIWRTMDGGDSWHELTEGLPQGDKGRIGLDIYRGNTDWIYAVVEADARGANDGDEENGVYRSWDRGNTWEQVSTENPRPMYYSQIRVDPNDAERVYLGGADFYMSQDGGEDFTDEAAEEVHLDHHAIWINPADSDHIILGSDGGVSISFDRSETWRQLRNLPVSQFYEIGLDMNTPYRVCGGLQDNGSWCAPSDTWSGQGIRDKDWFNVGGGDGFFTEMHPNGRLMFAESQGGNLVRVDLVTREGQRGVRPRAYDEDGEEMDLRRNWSTPILSSSHSDSRIYYGANMLFRSDDLGHSWERISDDVTYAIDRDELEIMGVPGSAPQMSRNDGQSTYGNITAIAESPVDENVLYTGADDGRLMGTRDGGSTWTDLTDNVPGLPDNTYVTRLIASHADAGTIYAAFDGHRSDDFSAYVYRSGDYGASWDRITDGLPEESVNALEQHPRNPNLWFVGNEVGVFVSVDAGGTWHRMHSGLPTVPVDDIDIHPRENDLVLGTHGRGIWIMDDITPLENLGTDAMMADVELFGVRHAISRNSYNPQEWPAGIWQADNGPRGARFRFHVGHEVAAANDSLTLTVADLSGASVAVIRREAEAGVHEYVWNLGMQMEGPDGEMMAPGPRVYPGSYQVTLSVGDRTSAAQSFDVLVDPRADISASDLMARHVAMAESYRLSGWTNPAGDALDEAEEALESAMERVEEAGDEEVMETIQAALDRRDELEDMLDDAGEGARAWSSIQSIHMPPTEAQLQSIERSRAELPGAIRELNAWLADELPAALRSASQVAMPEPDAIGPVPVPPGG